MKNLLIALSITLLITSCAETVKPETDKGPDTSADTSSIDSGENNQANQVSVGKHVSYEEGAVNDPNNVLSEKIIYFGYDSNTVADNFIELVKHHGKYLSLNPNARVRLEGHGDERGSREYNIALGERRALAVKQIMTYQGATSGQFSVISYGEEKPASLGHDESSWEANRRVELIYQ